ncbi:MAG: protoglobin domain-containing protein [Burkholderiales bacterium]
MNLSDEAIATLARAIRVDALEITRPKAFLEFDETELRLLTELHTCLQEMPQRFANGFYTHLLNFEETRRFILDVPSLERIKQVQAIYFDSLTAGDYGPEYFLQRLRMGIIHQYIGLEPKWYIGSYSKYLTGLLAELWQWLGEGSYDFIPTSQALIKIVHAGHGAHTQCLYASRPAYYAQPL